MKKKLTRRANLPSAPIVSVTPKIPLITNDSRANNKDKDTSVSIDPLYKLTPLERFQQLPNIIKSINANMFANLLAIYHVKPLPEIQAIIKAGNLSLLELQIAISVEKVLQRNKDSFEHTKYLHNRMLGSIKQTIEYSGLSSPQVQNETNDLIAEFTIEELNQIKQIAFQGRPSGQEP